MKKIIYSMLMLAAMFTFTACEDVPMPYDFTSLKKERLPKIMFTWRVSSRK